MNRWRNEPSNSFVLVDSGVPQGSVLGLALFVLYRNDLPQQTYSTLRLFANDTTRQRPVSKTEDQAVLQNDLNDLAAWEGRWNMRFHPNKREILSTIRALKSPDYRGKKLFSERQGLQGIRQTGTRVYKLCLGSVEADQPPRIDRAKCSEMDSAEVSQDI